MQSLTIWGPIQTATPIADGIQRVTTASHGGFILSETRLHKMPQAFPHGAEGQFERSGLVLCRPGLSPVFRR